MKPVLCMVIISQFLFVGVTIIYIADHRVYPMIYTRCPAVFVHIVQGS